MPAPSISIERAKQNKLFYFVANGLVYRKEDGRCLLLKRSESEIAHPGKYATPGGKMEWEDFDLNNPTRVNGEVLDFLGSVEDLLRREIEEEAGVTVNDDFQFINSNTFVRPDGIPVVMVKLAASYKDGDVVLEEGSFDDFAWVNEQEARELDCIGGIAEEIQKTIELFS